MFMFMRVVNSNLQLKYDKTRTGNDFIVHISDDDIDNEDDNLRYRNYNQ